MDWTAFVDAYGERAGPGFWAEPLNAVSNAAFLVAALVMAWRLRGSGLVLGWVLVAVLVLVGVSSWLWHTLAVAWAGAADSGFIAVFILVYVYAANRHFMRWPPWIGGPSRLSRRSAAACCWALPRTTRRCASAGS